MLVFGRSGRSIETQNADHLVQKVGGFHDREGLKPADARDSRGGKGFPTFLKPEISGVCEL